MSILTNFNTFPVPSSETGKLTFIQYPLDIYTGATASPNIYDATFTRGGSRAVIDKTGDIIFIDANKPMWSFPFGGERNGKPYLALNCDNIYTDLSNHNFSNSHGSSTDVIRFSQTFRYITGITTSSQLVYYQNIVPTNTPFTISAVVKKISGDDALSVGVMIDNIAGGNNKRTELNEDGSVNIDNTGKVLDSGVNYLGQGYNQYWIHYDALGNSVLTHFRFRYFNTDSGSVEFGMINLIGSTGVESQDGMRIHSIHQIAPISTSGTLSKDQFILDNLISRNITSSSGFSFRLNIRQFFNGGINGDNFIGFRTTTTGIINIFLISDNNSIRLWDDFSNYYIGNNIESDFILTFDNEHVSVYGKSGKTHGYTFSSTYQIDEFIMGSGLDNYVEIAEGPSFLPYVLTEADAVAALRKTDFKFESLNSAYKIDKCDNIITDNLFFHIDANKEECYTGSHATQVISLANNANRFLSGACSTNRLIVDKTSVFKIIDDYIYYDNVNFSSLYITVCFWVNLKTDTGRNYAIDSDGDREPVFKWVDNDPTSYIWGLGSTGYNTSNNDGLRTNEWNYFCMTYDGTNEILYRNGEQLQSETGGSDTTINFNELFIGNSKSGTSYIMNGNINDVKIYTTGLTQTQILQNYNATRYKYVNF